MATSEYTALVRYPSSAVGENYPVGSAIYKDSVVNNLKHLADQYGQQLVNFVARTSSEFTTQAPASTTVWYPIMPCGLYMLTCRANGVPYPLVVRIAGFASAANNVTFRVVICPRGDSEAAVQVATVPTNIIEVTTNSTSSAYRSPTPYIATISSDMARDMVEDISTSDDANYDIPRTRQIVRAEISVWGKTSNVAATPTLSGLNVREYIGGP